MLLSLLSLLLGSRALGSVRTEAAPERHAMAYLFVDCSQSMRKAAKPDNDFSGVDEDDKTYKGTRYEQVTNWALEEARIRLLSGRDVILIPFNTVEAGSKTLVSPREGERTEARVRALVEEGRTFLLSLKVTGDTAIWRTIYRRIDRDLGDAGSGTVIGVYTDGEDNDSGSISELDVKNALKKHWKLDINSQIGLFIYTWSAKVLPAPVALEILETKAAARRTSELGAGAEFEVSVRVAAALSERATAADRLEVTAAENRDADAARQVTCQSAAAAPIRLVDVKLDHPLTKDASTGTATLKFRVLSAVTTEDRFLVTLNGVYTSQIAGLEPGDRVRGVKAERQIEIPVSKLAPRFTLEASPGSVSGVVGEETGAKVSLRVEDGAAGARYTVSAESDAGAEVLFDAGQAGVSADRRSCTGATVAGVQRAEFAVKIKGSRAGAGQVRFRVHSDGAERAAARASFSFSAASVKVSLKSPEARTDLEAPGRWTAVAAGPIVMRLEGAPQGATPGVRVRAELRQSGVVEFAFSENGSQNVEAGLGEAIPVFARYKGGQGRVEAEVVLSAGAGHQSGVGIDPGRLALGGLVRLPEAGWNLLDAGGASVRELDLGTVAAKAGGSGRAAATVVWSPTAGGLRAAVRASKDAGVGDVEGGLERGADGLLSLGSGGRGGLVLTYAAPETPGSSRAYTWVLEPAAPGLEALRIKLTATTEAAAGTATFTPPADGAGFAKPDSEVVIGELVVTGGGGAGEAAVKVELEPAAELAATARLEGLPSGVGRVGPGSDLRTTVVISARRAAGVGTDISAVVRGVVVVTIAEHATFALPGGNPVRFPFELSVKNPRPRLWAEYDGKPCSTLPPMGGWNAAAGVLDTSTFSREFAVRAEIPAELAQGQNRLGVQIIDAAEGTIRDVGFKTGVGTSSASIEGAAGGKGADLVVSFAGFERSWFRPLHRDGRIRVTLEPAALSVELPVRIEIPARISPMLATFISIAALLILLMTAARLKRWWLARAAAPAGASDRLFGGLGEPASGAGEAGAGGTSVFSNLGGTAPPAGASPAAPPAPPKAGPGESWATGND